MKRQQCRRAESLDLSACVLALLRVPKPFAGCTGGAGGWGLLLGSRSPWKLFAFKPCFFSSAPSNLRSLAFVGHRSDLPCYRVLDGAWDVFDQLSEADISQQRR